MWVRGLIVWLAIITAETVHGIARAAVLVPYVGDLRARQIGVFTGSLIILGIATACVRWIGAATRGQLLALGVAWLGLTLTFELVVGKLVLGYSWQRLLADFNPADGGLLALGMLVLAFSPLIAARIRRIDHS